MSLTTQYTETYIANIALRELSVGEIDDIETNTSKGGTLARLWYPIARDLVQSAYPWSICRTRYANIASEATGPAWKWSYAHAIPPTTLRVLNVNKDEWDIESIGGARHVVANATPISIFTIDRSQNTAIYSPIMITAIAKWLVSLLARPLTGQQSNKVTALQEFRDLLDMAKTVDSFQGAYEDFTMDDLIEHR